MSDEPLIVSDLRAWARSQPAELLPFNWKSGNEKLTPAERRQIATLLDYGWPARDIAAVYGVTARTVYRQRRQCWMAGAE